LAKKKSEKPHREITKHQLSRWQRQEKRRHIIFGVGVFIIVAVLSIIGVGWYVNQYQPMQQTVLRVNDVEFRFGDFVNMLKSYGAGETATSMYEMTDEVINIIERNELVRQGAMELGISVSDGEVNQELKSFDPPLSKDFKDLVRTEMIIKKLLGEHFEQLVPVSAEQRHILAMLLESESQANEVRDRLEGGEDFADLAGELSLEQLSKTQSGDLGWRPQGALTTLLNTSIPDDYAFNSEVRVLSQPIYDETVRKGVGYWLIEVLDRDQEMETAFVKVILLGTEIEAQEVKARLDGGEDFAVLAEEFSLDYFSSGSGGEVGWVDRVNMTTATEEYVFNSELETVSEPIRDEAVRTAGGYWLLKVVEIDDNREISEENRDVLKVRALDEWVSALLDDPDNDIENYLDDEMKWLAVSKATEGQN